MNKETFSQSGQQPGYQLRRFGTYAELIVILETHERAVVPIGSDAVIVFKKSNDKIHIVREMLKVPVESTHKWYVCVALPYDFLLGFTLNNPGVIEVEWPKLMYTIVKNKQVHPFLASRSKYNEYDHLADAEDFLGWRWTMNDPVN